MKAYKRATRVAELIQENMAKIFRDIKELNKGHKKSFRRKNKTNKICSCSKYGVKKNSNYRFQI